MDFKIEDTKFSDNIIAVITKPKTSINIKKSNSSDTYQFSPQNSLFI